MIRPFTVVCMLMAVGSGLYLYQCKHQAQVLDREIARTIKQTDAARDRIAMLRAEWAQLNEPERVAELARAHTTLQTAKPTQFMALNDLAAKLPAVAVPTRPSQPTDVPEDTEAAPPVVQAEPRPTPRVASAAPEPKPDVKPTPHPAAAADVKPARPAVPAPAAPAPAPSPQVASVHPVARPLPPPHAPAANAVPVNADATAPGTVGAAVLRAMRAREAQAAPYVQPVAAPAPAYTPPAPAPAAYTPQASAAGSMLGGTRSSLPPPVPFAAR